LCSAEGKKLYFFHDGHVIKMVELQKHKIIIQAEFPLNSSVSRNKTKKSNVIYGNVIEVMMTEADHTCQITNNANTKHVWL